MHFYYYQRRKTEEAKRVKRAQRLMRGTHDGTSRGMVLCYGAACSGCGLSVFEEEGRAAAAAVFGVSADSALAAGLPENLEK